ncbi:unnamed protein product [Trichobilharzia szidati]|nr:unnamed protein product [Trichobilharzia szidati]
MTGGSTQISEEFTEVSLIYRQHYENWILWRNSILFLLLLCTGIFISIDLYNISDKKFNNFHWNNHPHFGRQHSQILNSLNIIRDLVTASDYYITTTEKVSSSISSSSRSSSSSSTSSLMNDESGDNNNNSDRDLYANEGKLNRTAMKHHYSNNNNNLFRRNVQLQRLTKSCLNMESIDWNMILRRDKTYYRYEFDRLFIILKYNLI